MPEGHTGWVWDVAISPDGAKIVSGSDDKTVRVWSMETGEVTVCLRVSDKKSISFNNCIVSVDA